MPIETIVVFFTASLALGLAPGPDNIFVLTQSAMHGPKAGLLVTLGLCTGLLVHTAMVSLGVAAIFQASAFAFIAVKAIGVCYLLYLSWQAFCSPVAGLGVASDVCPSLSALYVRGIVMNITNPKVAIFFLAFLPQFADPNLGALAPQMLFFGGLFIFATLFVFGGIAWGAGFISGWLKGSIQAQQIINRMTGTVLAVLAINLALAQR